MHAVAYRQPLPIDHADALIDIDVPAPEPGPHDLLVEVRAVSVNPVDVKLRASAAPPDGQPRILGFDAAGVVRAVGAQVAGFQPGDRVWYAGDISRPGSNAELQLVDARIAARMPNSLNFAEAAALPLTSLTAWELLFDRLRVQLADLALPQRLLVVGAAGGVGSILLQLARTLTGLEVIGTASRPASQAWVKARGAHGVIDHHQPWLPQLQALGVGAVEHVISLNHSQQHLPQIVEVLAPEGQLALIDDPQQLDVTPLKRKALSIHWELMFTRSLYQTPTLARQGAILQRVAALVDAGRLHTTATERWQGIDAATLRRAHAWQESGRAVGKLVLER